MKEAVEIVGQKRQKADHHGKIADLLQAGQDPKKDQHQIVGGVDQGKIRAPPKGKVHGQEAGGHRKGAGEKMRGIQPEQQEGKEDRDHQGQEHRQTPLPGRETLYLHLCPISPKGMAEPGHQRHHRHGKGHAKIGDHFSVIGKGIGDPAVEQAEHHHECLSYGVPLGVEDQGRNADEGGDQGGVILAVKQKKEENNPQYRGAPKGDLGGGEIGMTVLHGRILRKKEASATHLLRPNDV